MVCGVAYWVCWQLQARLSVHAGGLVQGVNTDSVSGMRCSDALGFSTPLQCVGIGCLQGCRRRRVRTWRRDPPCCWRRRCAKRAAGSQVLTAMLHAVMPLPRPSVAARRAGGRQRSAVAVRAVNADRSDWRTGLCSLMHMGCASQAAARRRADAAAAPWSLPQTWAASRCWTGRRHRQGLTQTASPCPAHTVLLIRGAVGVKACAHMRWNGAAAGQRAGSQARAALAAAQSGGLGRPPGS